MMRQWRMLRLLTLLVTLANGLPRSHCDLLLENFALRQPLAALTQRHSRPRLVENCRRELFNHVIVLNERHLKCLMSEVGRPESSPAQKTVNSQISGPAPRVCLALDRRIPTAPLLIKLCDRALPNSLRPKAARVKRCVQVCPRTEFRRRTTENIPSLTTEIAAWSNPDRAGECAVKYRLKQPNRVPAIRCFRDASSRF